MRRLLLQHFRNYAAADIQWHEQINLLTGLNAQGKSNLLEAITYLSLTTSFRSATEQELLSWQAPHFYLEAEICSQACGQFVLSAAYERSKRKRWRVDGQACRRRSQIVGLLHTVIFSPEDVDLVKAGPAQRRRYLNRQISQLEAEHFTLLQQYNKTLSQRNGCLRRDFCDSELLAVWDQQLAHYGAAIITRRQAVLAQLAPLAAELHGQLAGRETLELRYKSFFPEQDVSDPLQLEALFLAELARLRTAELARRMTLVGPHRDDLQIIINGNAAKGYASQGQQRTAALALKLAELELAEQQRGEAPVLLLDDVLSELDEKRRNQLLQRISGHGQTFITTTEPNLPLPVGQVWRIVKGTIIKV